MSINGVTFDERSDLDDGYEDFIRDYAWSGDRHLRVAQPNRQYLLIKSKRLEEINLIPEDITSDYVLLRERGDIQKGRIEPDRENDYNLSFENGTIREEEISWKEAEEIISSIS